MALARRTAEVDAEVAALRAQLATESAGSIGWRPRNPAARPLAPRTGKPRPPARERIRRRSADLGIGDMDAYGPADDGSGSPPMYELRLYLAGHSPKSVRAVENLRRTCEEYLPGRYRIELVDLLENPQLARGDEIIAVPTLVGSSPSPSARSSATCRTPRSCWSGCSCAARVASSDAPGRRTPSLVADAVRQRRLPRSRRPSRRSGASATRNSRGGRARGGRRHRRPALAARDRIVAVPTLVKRLPAPPRQLVGDLADVDRLRAGLDLGPTAAAVTDPPEDGVGGRRLGSAPRSWSWTGHSPRSGGDVDAVVMGGPHGPSCTRWSAPTGRTG